MKKSTLLKTVILTIMMVTAMMLGGVPVSADADPGTVYYSCCDSYGENWSTSSCSEYTVLTNETSLGAANTNTWYVVNGESLKIDSRITVAGTVNLILLDGKELKAKQGITTTGATLNIYAGSTTGTIEGTGKLTVTGAGEGQAGIGGGHLCTGDTTVNIHGGKVEAIGGKSGSAGIGGGSDGLCNVNIDGGEVKAQGPTNGAGAGIGTGEGSGSGAVVILGGKVDAIDGAAGSVGIGSGEGQNNTVTLTLPCDPRYDNRACK